jgi:predicted SAM-dependent methyltransferase
MADASRLREALERIRPLVVLKRSVHRRLRQTRSRLRRALDPIAIRRYLGTHRVRKLQIGTGPNPLTGWLNTDLDIDPQHRDLVVFLDATKRFPFDDMTFDYILSEHQIEHIAEADALAMVRECFRVLRPGGRVRIATPDLAAIVRLYDDPLDHAEQHYVEWAMATLRPDVRSGNPRCYVINQMFGAYGHRFIYDHDTLSQIISGVGFVDVGRQRPGESDDPVLRGVESHGRALGDEEVNRLETMVLEATRPPARADVTTQAGRRR